MRSALLLAAVLAFGCTKKPKSSAPAATPAASPAPSGGGSTNYQAGGGAVQNVRQAGRRTVELNDLKNLGLEVETAFNETGKMPSAERVTELAKANKNLAEAIGDGSLIVTGTSQHGGVWVYEADAPEKGGIALIGPVAQRVQADELSAKLKLQ